MQITLTNTGKRYNREWIFRHINYEFKAGRSYAITGPNGSGKSTLLQVIAGAVMHSEGEIGYNDPGSGIRDPGLINEPYKQISLAAPYLELIEEMTAAEFLKFHSAFKSLTIPISEMLLQVGIAEAANKQIRYFSSGMKQRLKLGMAFFSNSNVLLLDEPSTNLDSDGIELYHRLIQNYSKEKLVIVSSNDKIEYDFCEELIAINNYK
ncbi:MAG: ABC transporter ATP-binding protein [Ferruginibacter sp.]